MASEKTKTQVKELTDMLENGVRDLYQSDKYQAYLDNMASLMQFSPSRYSARNYALIYMQNPDATLVAGFNAWKQLDRHVTGEAKGKGIKILAPNPYVIKTEEQKVDEETEAPLFDNEGIPVMEEVEKTIPNWKYVTVFDIKETDGKPLPHLAEDLAGNVLHYDAFMDTLREISPLPIVFENLPPEVDGRAYYGDRIALREGMSQRQTVSAAVHELGHAVLHDTTRDTGENEAEAPHPAKSAREIEAESVSYVICKRFGIDTGANSFGYLASYEKEADTAGLLKSLKTIQETAAGLIDKIDMRFHEICEERGIDLSPVEAIHAPPEREAAEQFAGEYYEFLSGVTDKAGERPFSLDSRDQTVSDIAEEIVTGNHQDMTAMLHNASDYGFDPSRLLKKFDRLINTTPWVFPDDPTAANEIDGLQTPAQAQAASANSEAEPPTATENAAMRPTELQHKGIEIAKRYEMLPLQDRMNMIAETFGCKTASIRTSPCTGKWRGTSDISLVFDNGASLFIGNYRTPQAKTARVQNECVNGTLTAYNPEILAETKERITPALLKREAEDNAIAAGKGLKPYTFLNVELNDGSDEQSGGHLGWYYATVAVDGKIFGLVETGLNHDIARGVLRESRPNYFVAGALKENEVDFVYDNVGHSSTSGLYKLHLSDNARERAEKTLVERLATEPQEQAAPANPEKQYDLGYGHMGNGLTVWNRLEEKNGDYVTVAHIDPDRSVTFYDKDMPDSVKARIEDVARTSNMTVSATQDTPVFTSPAQTPDLDLPAPGPAPSVILPDPAISPFERDLYGYTDPTMLPLQQDRALELFDADHTIYMLYPDNTEAMVFDRDEITTYASMNKGIFGIAAGDWELSEEYQSLSQAAQSSEAAKESDLIHGGGNAFGIYQLKDGAETRDYRWESLASLVTQGLFVDRANYELVYTGPLIENDTLDSIYEKFNIDHPPDFTGHSLSVSDVVVLQQNGNLSSHYVDSLGFKGLPAFLGNEKQAQITPPVQPEQIKNSYVDLLKEHINNHYDAGYLTDADRDILSANMEGMNTYMMDFANKYEAGVPLDVETDTIDRMFQDRLAKSREQTEAERWENDQIADVSVSTPPTPAAPAPPTPTVAELEAEVKAGNQISLTDLARAVKNEPKQPPAKKEKPSILAQLKELKQAAQNKDPNNPAPKRGNDLEV